MSSPWMATQGTRLILGPEWWVGVGIGFFFHLFRGWAVEGWECQLQLLRKGSMRGEDLKGSIVKVKRLSGQNHTHWNCTNARKSLAGRGPPSFSLLTLTPNLALNLESSLASIATLQLLPGNRLLRQFLKRQIIAWGLVAKNPGGNFGNMEMFYQHQT